MDRKLFSKIRNNMDYKPSKATALAFAFALELDINETRDFIGSDVYSALSKIDKFNLINVCEDKVYSEGDLTFSFYKMTHPVLSYGVRLSDGISTFSYTGDTTVNDNLPRLLSGSDLAVCDGAFIESDYDDKKPHMSIKQASSLAKYSKKVLVSHISSRYSDEIVTKEILSITDRAEVAIENKTYDF